MLTPLSSSYMYRSFQLIANLDLERMSSEEAFDYAGNLIYGWAKHKCMQVFNNLPYRKESLELKRDGTDVILIQNWYINVLNCLLHPIMTTKQAIKHTKTLFKNVKRLTLV